MTIRSERPGDDNVFKRLSPGIARDMPPQDEVECALSLFRELKRNPKQWVAVMIEPPTGWRVAKPRSQFAMTCALATVGPETEAIIRRMCAEWRELNFGLGQAGVSDAFEMLLDDQEREVEPS